MLKMKVPTFLDFITLHWCNSVKKKYWSLFSQKKEVQLHVQKIVVKKGNQINMFKVDAKRLW